MLAIAVYISNNSTMPKLPKNGQTNSISTKLPTPGMSPLTIPRIIPMVVANITVTRSFSNTVYTVHDFVNF